MTNSKTLQFIQEHQNSDVHKLALKKRIDVDIDYEFAYRQLAGRQKIKLKLPSFYQTNGLIYPPQLNIEQCSSESTALYKKNLCEGELMVDLTGGFGIDFYYLSLKFKKAIYIEQNKELCEVVAHNLKLLKCENVEIINAKAQNILQELPFLDLVYIDPARRNKSGGKTVFITDCEPDITVLYEKILKKTNTLLVKLSPMLDISAALSEMKSIHEVHIISVANECKEVLLVFKPIPVSKIKYLAINILANKTDIFEFNKEGEQNTNCNYATDLQKYLYEPNSSILKAGAFKTITSKYDIFKLHKNTHLYTTNTLISNFQGRVFEIIEIKGNSKKDIADIKIVYPKANISTRNYPLKPDELKKKIGIADGGDIYIFACTINNDSKVLIICKKAFN